MNLPRVKLKASTTKVHNAPGKRFSFLFKMDNLKSRDATKSEIRTFFDGTNVFLTGGTGAVGQVLLEKLLR
jgi:FlaA1/EpsC-like NDP-sugar epimerase